MSARPLLWSLIQQIGRQCASYVIFVILAALLSPKDFGVLGVATSWLAFLAVFAELGFGVALIQHKNISSAHYSSTFFLNLAMGVMLCLLCLALANPAASFLGIPEAGPVIMVLSVGLLISPFSQTQAAVAQKELRFKNLAKRDILGGIGGGLVGIAFAVAGCGIWSLVAQTLSGALFGAVLIWNMSAFRPRFSEVSMAPIRDLWGYSSTMFLHKFFKFAVQNSDRLLVGFFLGAEPLGLYTFANKIILMPAASLRGAIGAYLFPLLSRMQGNLSGVKDAYLEMNRAISRLLVPGILLTGAFVPILLPLAFGGKWDSAVPLAQILAMVGACQFLFEPVGDLMKAMGRPKWLLVWSVVFAALTTGLLIIGCQWDIITVGWSLALSHTIALPITLVVARKMIPLDASDFARIIWPLPLFAIPVLALTFWRTFSSGGSSPALAAGVFASMLPFAAATAWSQRHFLKSFHIKPSADPTETAPLLSSTDPDTLGRPEDYRRNA